MKCVLFFLGILITTNSFSQNRNNIWYFGTHAGINFNTNPPTALTNSPIDQQEGTSTICDNNGNLLFYTDGVLVWNRNHSVMPNGTGLLGGFSSTQSALIIPKPCDSNIYYIFTVPQTDSVTPLSYSILDIRLDGGLGDLTVKNIPLHVPITERLTATLKQNGSDYWIMAKEYGTDAFLAYTVNSSGVDTIPVISHSGIATSVEYNMLGYMRISPDDSKLCIAYWGTGPSQLFDFNVATGIVSNPITLNSANPYGVEFSPDNSKLYIAEASGFLIRQYDLSAGSPVAIQNSATVIADLGPSQFSVAVMRGPDNKIYAAKYGAHYLCVINEPNLPGLSCNFIDDYFALGPGTCLDGLPNNINRYSLCLYCPSIVNINSNVSICPNEHYQLPSGEIVNIAGVYYDTTKNQFSCDSIITAIQLQVNNNSASSHIDSIYSGEQYILPSGDVTGEPGTYQSILNNSQGCDSVITTTLKLRRSLSECLILQNAFTPNGDGVNDEWILYRYNCFKKLEVNVYNRYGSIVYHSDDYKNEWNGKYKNKDLPDGTYYYVIKVISFNNKEHIFKDNLTILR